MRIRECEMFVFPTIWRASFSFCLRSEIHPTVVTRKQSTPNLPKNKHFLPLDTHTYMGVSWVRDARFFRKFGLLYFLVTSVLIFTLLPNLSLVVFPNFMWAILVVFPTSYYCEWKDYRENFLWKTRDKGLFPFTLCVFDFAGRYMRRFVSEDLLLAYAQTFTLSKIRWFAESNYCLKAAD